MKAQMYSDIVKIVHIVMKLGPSILFTYTKSLHLQSKLMILQEVPLAEFQSVVFFLVFGTSIVMGIFHGLCYS